MEAALTDDKPNPNYDVDDGLQVSYPLVQCLKELKEKYATVSALHRERFEQVRSTLPTPDNATHTDARRTRRSPRLVRVAPR